MDVEFFAGSDGNVWYRQNASCQILTISDDEIIEYMIDKISRVYPGTYARLRAIYNDSGRNRRYFNYLIVDRFIRCNLGDDDIQKIDISSDAINMEFVKCPLRGICKDEGIICNPPKQNLFSPSERKVAVLYSNGFSIKEIAIHLKKNISTVNNQLWRITKKLGIKSRRQIVAICHSLNLT